VLERVRLVLRGYILENRGTGDKERLRQLQLREEGQDRIIRPVTLHHSSVRTHHHSTMHHRTNMHSDH
jgi:hypothetical protein